MAGTLSHSLFKLYYGFFRGPVNGEHKAVANAHSLVLSVWSVNENEENLHVYVRQT